MPPATVSVIVPVFNAESYLDECLASIQAQSYVAIDVICVNDGSADRSRDILALRARQDQRIRVLNQANGGVSAARNAGLRTATGDYVMFVDADDTVEPDTVAALVGAMTQSVDLVVEGDEHPAAYEGQTGRGQLLYRGLRTALLTPPWGKLYRLGLVRRIGLEFEAGVSLGEDLLFNVEYLRHASSVRTIPGRRYRNRVVAGSLTRSYRETKYQDLALVHRRLRVLTVDFRSERLDSLLSFLRIKSLISCGRSLLGPGSPLTSAEARRRIDAMAAENAGLRVPTGDRQMLLVGWAYRRLGLWRTTRLVHAAQTLAPLRRHARPTV